MSRTRTNPNFRVKKDYPKYNPIEGINFNDVTTRKARDEMLSHLDPHAPTEQERINKAATQANIDAGLTGSKKLSLGKKMLVGAGIAAASLGVIKVGGDAVDHQLNRDAEIGRSVTDGIEQQRIDETIQNGVANNLSEAEINSRLQHPNK